MRIKSIKYNDKTIDVIKQPFNLRIRTDKCNLDVIEINLSATKIGLKIINFFQKFAE